MKKTITILILLLACFVAQAQERLIIGTVKDDQGIGLLSISIIVKGTIKGTVTDEEGKYKINIKQGDVLVFNTIGYITQEIEIETQSVIDVILKENTNALQDIVVIADEVQEKKYITGIASVTKGKKSKKRANPRRMSAPNNKR